jgi:large subunit ribosomal protein L29
MANIEDLRGKSPDELKELALSLKKELFNLRFQVASGELTNTSRFRVVRRDVARVKTLLNDPQQSNLPAKKEAKPAKVKKAAPAKAEAKEPKAKKTTAKKKASGE